MRHIAKPQGSAAEQCIQKFIDAQMAGRATDISWTELRVDYGSFADTRRLCSLLVKEQKGLCAYTGVGLDERLIERAPGGQQPPRTDYAFKAHNEHLKSQSQCRAELQERAGVVGQDVGDDVAYSNIVAAIEVSGNPNECFGAAYRGSTPVPIIPTDPICESAFIYMEKGGIDGFSTAAKETVSVLRLDHKSLADWRSGAIRGLLPKGEQTPRETLEQLIRILEDEQRETLPEFSFVVTQIARAYLASQSRVAG